MVVMEFKLVMGDDFRVGDTIIITNRTTTGWKGTLNNKHEILFETPKFDVGRTVVDGSILLEANNKWEKVWAVLKESPFQIGVFKSEQEKSEKLRTEPAAVLENLLGIEEEETIESTYSQAHPPVRFNFRTPSRTFNCIISGKDNMVNLVRDTARALSKPPSSPTAKAKVNPTLPVPTTIIQYRNPTTPPPKDLYQNSQSNANTTTSSTSSSTSTATAKSQPYQPPRAPQITINLPAPVPQAQTPSAQQQPSSPTAASQIGGGGGWFKKIVSSSSANSKSSLNVATKGSKDDSSSNNGSKKGRASASISKSASNPEISIYPRNTQVGLSSRTGAAPAAPVSSPSPTPTKIPSKERKVLTRVYWRDGTYRTVPVSPGITAKEVCEQATKKTKIAIFENLFCLYECLSDGTENILDNNCNVYDLLINWGEESENHLVCDLNLDTKNTVKSQLRKTIAPNHDSSELSSLYDDPDFDDVDGFDPLDDDFESEDQKSIEKMIQEMIKLKQQLQQEDAMIEQLAMEEQQVDVLISRLANL